MTDKLRRMTLVLAALVAGACVPLPTGEPVPEPIRPGSTPDRSSTTSEPVGVPDPTRGRDAALTYVGWRYGLALPRELRWNETVITPERLVGSHAVKYTSSTWDATIHVSMPVVAPQHVYYNVRISDPATGFQWEGKVDARGNVTETAAVVGERETATQVPVEDLQALVSGNSAFAFDLYQALSEEAGNLFFSPHSISLALAMTYAGARGDTMDEMAGTLRFTLPQDRLHMAVNLLDLELAQRGEEAGGRDDGGFRLHVANALWGQTGYPFLAEFRDVLARNYGAGLRLVDFAADAEPVRRTINDWVSEQTEGRIENLIPQGVLDAATRLVLTNAIYFDAAWAKPFAESATQDGSFYRLDGSEVDVPLMRQTEVFGYARGEGYQAIELPYRAEELSMVLLLPDAGQFESFEAGLDAATVDAIVEDRVYRELDLMMPRFKFESEFSLAETLQDMGMSLPFSERADFSGMTGDRDLFISAVLHKAFVAVDEEGTEAAAATAVAMKLSAMPAEPLEVRVDRPFILFIRDIPTGSILFCGRVLDPSG